MASLLSKRFAELAEQHQALMATERPAATLGPDRSTTLDSTTFLNWRVKAKSLILQACGANSVHVREFEQAGIAVLGTSLVTLARRLLAVFDAAREDFDGGYLSSVRNMVRAEVFESELEQAEDLLKSGYAVPAAVVAGTVLETTLRDLCTKHGLPHGKLDTMNAALAKAGEYSSLEQKQVTAQAAVRNAAAHGDSAKFRDADVEPMIRYIERFVIDHPVI